MPSVFKQIIEFIEQLGPTGIVAEAIAVTAVGIGLLLAFILGRRAWKARLFRRRDRRTLAIRQQWDDIVSGKLPYADWRFVAMDRGIIEAILLDRLEIAQPAEAELLLRCLRDSGLLDM
ncbi:MAG TPA: hypothetical protein VGQ11_10130, partial [Candidatus Acidoferrales bacterium]|nr:hypothetical protein [Candidatus Acidoferrales bacterium]